MLQEVQDLISNLACYTLFGSHIHTHTPLAVLSPTEHPHLTEFELCASGQFLESADTTS